MPRTFIGEQEHREDYIQKAKSDQSLNGSLVGFGDPVLED